MRTSPDHGTGYDIAGKGLASPASLREAVYAAIDTAIRGFCTPKSRRKERSRRVSLSTISSLVRASGTLETGVWTVARATRICSLHRIVNLNNVDSASEARDGAFNIVNVVGEDLKIEPGQESEAAGAGVPCLPAFRTRP